jgi:hypothetical protein
VKRTLVIIDGKKKGCNCYIPVWKKVVTSKDVTIDEKGNLIHHVDVRRHKDVTNESQVKIQKNLPPLSNWNTNC